jgi:hypothetical protein
MTWNELYPVVTEQAKYAVLRYDERRNDKIQELVCQTFEKFKSDTDAGKEIKKQPYKCFVTQRAKEVDFRSVCKDGFGGTSQLDPLGFFHRRADSPIAVCGFDELLAATPKSREADDSNLVLNVDYGIWINGLNDLQKKVVEFLIQGFNLEEIAEFIKATISEVKSIVKEIRQDFLNYFELDVCP